MVTVAATVLSAGSCIFSGGKNKVVLANYVLHYAIADKQCDNKLVIRTYADLPPNHAFAKQREKKE